MPLAFPLWGSRLIEASAGTGKTFTLALLYTRLVLGHGGEDAAFARALMPPEILVVTFTDAATRELRDRIRQRLVEAAIRFEAESPHPQPPSAPGGTGLSPAGKESDLLDDLRATYPPEHWPGCARRLRLAAEWMDEAVISTIHSWCYRMLQEHAFDTRGLFNRELVTDQTDLLAEVVRDYWRVHFYPLSPAQALCVLEVVDSPAALRGKLDPWLKRREAALSYKGAPLPGDALDVPLARQCQWRAARVEVEAEGQRLAARLAELEQTARELWRTHRATLDAYLRELRPDLNGTTHGSTHADQLNALLAAIAAWSEGAAAPGKLKSFAQGPFKFKKTARITAQRLYPAFQAIVHWQAMDADQPSLPERTPNHPLKPVCSPMPRAGWGANWNGVCSSRPSWDSMTCCASSTRR